MSLKGNLEGTQEETAPLIFSEFLWSFAPNLSLKLSFMRNLKRLRPWTISSFHFNTSRSESNSWPPRPVTTLMLRSSKKHVTALINSVKLSDVYSTGFLTTMLSTTAWPSKENIGWWRKASSASLAIFMLLRANSGKKTKRK